MRLILDGVFNHCGRGFFPFADVLENGDHSPYQDWFHIKKFPLDAYSPGEAQNYLGWWNHKSLPKLNTDNPLVRNFIFNVARYWIEQGADGWRLDVPNEIDDDGFWEEFRHVVKSANRDAYLLGEIWHVNRRWANETHFDGLMNYPFRDALLAVLNGSENAAQFADRIETLVKAYARENFYAMYLPLGSHDTERIMTMVEGNLEKAKLAFLVQMALPGAPGIYYGDEIGLQGGKDPENRRAFPWKETAWNFELRSWVKTLIAARKRLPALRRGDLQRVLAEDGLYAFVRRLGEDSLLVALNTSARHRQIDVEVSPAGWESGREVRNVFSHEKMTLARGHLKFSLDPWSGAWIA
jgi:neopullulanase